MPSTPRPQILTDPGYLFYAPFGTPLPVHTAVGGKFTDPWPAAFLSPGATDAGSTLTYSSSVEPITVAEFLDPINYVTTERSGNIAFALASWTLTNLKRAMNGGAITVLGGSGDTLVSEFSPPEPGEEVRSVIGWESLDSTVRIIGEQCFNASELSSAFQKAPQKALIACQFNFEIPASGKPFRTIVAGEQRG